MRRELISKLDKQNEERKCAALWRDFILVVGNVANKTINYVLSI